MGINLFNNNRPKIWKIITENHLINHDDNNAILAVNSDVPVTLFVTNILTAGFSVMIVQVGPGTTSLQAVAPITISSAQGVTTTAIPNDILKVSSHLPNKFICEAAGSQVSGGGGGTPTKLRKYTAANFTDATKIDDPWLVGKSIAIFWNDVQRYLDAPEWDPTGTGLEITMPDFDAAVNNPTFYVMEMEAGGGGGGL